MKTSLTISTMFFVTFCAFAQYVAKPPRIARSLSDAQIDKVVAEAPRDANVGVPRWYAEQAQKYRAAGTNELVITGIPALMKVVNDTRQNIPEVEGLSDLEIAALYLAQMLKDADSLKSHAPTNTIEFLIGAGMRQDIEKAKGGR